MPGRMTPSARAWACVRHPLVAAAFLGAAAGLGAATPLAVAGPLSTATTRAAAASGSVPAGQPALHVIPFPGTPDASPQTQIIFSALKPSDLKAVIVTGSRSHLHMGTLTQLPDHAGTAFTPAHPFSPGDMVSVNAVLKSTAAGTASGDPGSPKLSFSFTVGVPAPPPGKTARTQVKRHLPPSLLQAFYSLPGVNPPAVRVSSRRAPGQDDIFLAPLDLMILNPRGQLVWAHDVRHGFANNLEVQHYHGKPVLTWWQGSVVTGHGVDGQDVILNHHYRPVAVLRGGWGYSSDLHEFQLTPQGTALIDAYVPVIADLRAYGGPSNGVLFDCVIQELDVRTGQVLWEWHALGHVPLGDSEWSPPPSGPYDPFHLNSIQQLSGHRLLVSLRNTWALYEIDERTGRVIWTLGGKASSFKEGPGAEFENQHDAHLYGHGLLSLFDDASPQAEAQSSAKELRINRRTRTVSLAQRYRHSPPLVTSTQGSTELMPNHKVFVGWGSTPDFSEYAPNGRQLFNAQLPLGISTYRAYRFAWTGQPRTRPALATSWRPGGAIWVYASWNGATQVAAWRVLGGSRRHALRALRVRTRTGFETRIGLRWRPHYVAVQALGAAGHVLGTSRVLSASGG
jgi:hypothetical protein